MTQFEITVTRRVASCDNDVMEVATEFEVKKKNTEDPSNTFVIDPTSLSHLLNKASTDIQFHEGTRYLKSINASVVDNVGPAVTSIAKAVAGIATLPITPGGGAAASLMACLQDNDPAKDIATLLGLANAQKLAVENLTRQINEQMLLVSRIVAEQTAKLPGREPELDANVAAAVSHLKALRELSEQEEKRLVELLKPITFVQKATWPLSGTEFSRKEPIRMPVEELEKWIGVGSGGPNQQRALDVGVSLEADTTVNVHLLQADDETPGIYYRAPRLGNLVFTRYVQQADGSARPEVMKRLPEVIAQLGYVNSLVIEARPFESMEYSAKFDANGGLVSAGYVATASASAAVTAMLEGVLTEYRTVATSEAGAAQAELDAELKRLKTEIDIKTANAALNPPATTEEAKALAALNAETTMLNAQIARIEAEKKLAALQQP
jgi:hypothetical protein